MKKVVSFVMALTFVFSLGFAGIAMAGGGKKAGEVKAIDEAAGTVTILFSGEDEPTTLKLDKKYLSTLEVGGNARIYFETDGCEVATRAKPLKEATIPVGC